MALRICFDDKLLELYFIIPINLKVNIEYRTDIKELIGDCESLALDCYNYLEQGLDKLLRN